MLVMLVAGGVTLSHQDGVLVLQRSPWPRAPMTMWLGLVVGLCCAVAASVYYAPAFPIAMLVLMPLLSLAPARSGAAAAVRVHLRRLERRVEIHTPVPQSYREPRGPVRVVVDGTPMREPVIQVAVTSSYTLDEDEFHTHYHLALVSESTIVELVVAQDLERIREMQHQLCLVLGLELDASQPRWDCPPGASVIQLILQLAAAVGSGTVLALLLPEHPMTRLAVLCAAALAVLATAVGAARVIARRSRPQQLEALRRAYEPHFRAR